VPVKDGWPNCISTADPLICASLHIAVIFFVGRLLAFGARRAKGYPMRAITIPPPSSRCEKCGGELRLKLIESANRGLDLEYEIFVCANCGQEQSLTVSHDREIPHTKAV
jgi:hypothetical protein